MKIKTPVEFQTYNDGFCAVYGVENIAEQGAKPVKGLREKFPRIPFERLKVGLTRYYEAMQADVRVQELVRIPRQRLIHTNDVCVISGNQYRIVQVQDVPDTLPPSTDLSLERVEVDYDIRAVL